MGRAVANKVYIIVPLGLLCVLVTVSQTQTVPYLMFNDSLTNLSNHSYIPLTNKPMVITTDIDRRSSWRLLCHTNLTGCCGKDDNITAGEWYFPNGSIVSTDKKFDIHMSRGNKRVRLIQKLNSNASIFGTLETNENVSGIYQCKIPINSSSEMEMGKIYAGVYERTKGIMH